MRQLRLGSYSTAATLAGTPSLFRRKSITRYWRLWPPPRCRDVVQSIFDVTVLKVNTLNRDGKRKRNRRMPTFGKRPDVKRAYVTLVEGDSIELFEV